jgi:hypothetical protein
MRKITFLALLTTLALSGCSTINADNADERMLKATDFGFETTELDGQSWVPSAGELSGFEQGDCAAVQSFSSALESGISVRLVGFQNRDGDNSFTIMQELIEFDSSAETSQVLEIAKEMSTDDSCGFNYSTSSTGPAGTVIAKSSTSFSNVESAGNKFEISANESVAWEVEATTTLTGGLYPGLFDEDESGYDAVIVYGNYLVLLQCRVETLGDTTVYLDDMLKGLKVGLKRL